jgi:peptidoglycan hydrolase-like protein with peptidoglycan-binding domain
MKINPKIAKTPEDLKVIEFKKMKVLIKKELKRLEKYTTPAEPTQFLILGEFDYPDKTAMALPVFGAWKGKFKEYAKKEVVKDKLGAIGTAYFGGIDESGQKKVHLNLAKGLGKNKSGKLERTLKKLIPQATYNVIFSEMDETLLDALEQKLDAAAEVEEVFEDSETEAEEALVDSNQDIIKLLTSNFKEIMAAFTPIKEVVIPRLRQNAAQEGDSDLIVDLVDLTEEWLSTYNSADADVRLNFQKQFEQIQKLKPFIQQALSRLEQKSGNVATGVPIEDEMSFIDNLMSDDEKPDSRFEVGLSTEGLKNIFIQQGQYKNCDATARMIVYKYLEKKGVVKIDQGALNKANGNSSLLKLYSDACKDDPVGPYLKDFVKSEGYEIDKIYDGKNTGTIPITEEINGKFIKSGAFEKAISYIDANLQNGVPVIAGIGIPNYSSGNADSSDHFIVIVGKSSKGFYYMDPGSQFGSNLEANILETVPGKDYMFKDSNLSWTAKYGDGSGVVVLTSVAVYPKDKEALSKISDIKVFEIQDNVTLHKGSENDIKVVQTLLQKAGYEIGTRGVDGDCGTSTSNAIIKFQEDHHIIPADGIVSPGSPTWLALKEKSGINPSPTLSPEDIQLSYDGSIQKLSADKELLLREMLAQAGEAVATIINTFRSAAEQAAVMFANIKQLGSKVNSKLYRVPAAAAQVTAAYEKAVSEGITEDAKLIGVILEAIEKVGADQLSGHCDSGNPAVDILPSSIKNRSKFEKIFNNKSLVAKFVAPPKDCSYHIEFK